MSGLGPKGREVGAITTTSGLEVRSSLEDSKFIEVELTKETFKARHH